MFAYNEEHNLPLAVQTVIEAARLANNLACEIIIVNDGSTDNTGKVIADLSRIHSNIRSIHHSVNTGIGTAIRDIVNAAKGDKICFVPGDDIFSLVTLATILRNTYKADIILHYHINSEVRRKGRAILSILFTSIYKFTFNLHVIYVNCIGTYPTALLKEIAIHTRRHGIAAELNVKTLLQGHSYYEVGSYMKPMAQKSSAISFSNLADAIISFIKIYFEVKIRNKNKYNKSPKRVIDSI
jgi:glycosyltransferase involved in cell wall biosynthesis